MSADVKTPIEWDQLKAVIFDVDGTLYDQRSLYRRMFVEASLYCLADPRRIKEMKILCDFRRERRKRAGSEVEDLDDQQYVWGSAVSGVSPGREREVVDSWLFERSLRHLPLCRRAGLLEFVEALRSRGIRTAVYSDYRAEEKVKALGLTDIAVFAGTDPAISSLKPNPKGLVVAVREMQLSIKECLLIGDRDDMDGECARRAGMKYLILERGDSFPKYSS